MRQFKLIYSIVIFFLILFVFVSSSASPIYAVLIYQSQFGSSGSGDGQFESPQGIVRDSNGNLFVIDTVGNNVQKFSSTGDFILKWGTSGSGDGQFSGPRKLGIDSDGNIYVADSANNRIQKFDNYGNFIMKFGTEGSGDGQLQTPYSATVDSEGNIYVAEATNNRISKFDSSGNFITNWGGPGGGDGQFGGVNSVFYHEGTGYIFAADTLNNRIQVFDTDGNFIRRWTACETIRDVKVDNDGNVYAACPDNHRVNKYTLTGTLIETYQSSGSGDGQLNTPFSVALDSAGTVWVVDTGNDRVQVFLDVEPTPTNTPIPTSTPSPTPTPTNTPSPTPTTTPTPTDTPKPTKNNNTSSTTSHPPSCSDSKPAEAPDLFQIDVSNTQAILYFAPATGAHKYFVSYGLDENTHQYGVEFETGKATGITSYTINMLSPNTTYTFTIRGGNGCMSGDWSNKMTIKTTNSTASYISYYKNFVSRILSFFPTQITHIPPTAPNTTKTTSTNSCEYTVESGDNLWNISMTRFGEGSKYTELMQENNLPSTLIHPGQRLKMRC